MPNDELWTRLKSFEMDDPGAEVPMSARLKRQNRWSLARTQRLMDEYRRFLYLACTQDFKVSPSSDVDKVWHEHMLHSRHYWDQLCGKVLKKRLHHEPSKGGAEDNRRCSEQYVETLAAYERVFSAPPPDDIWPRPKQTSEQSKTEDGLAGRVRRGLLDLFMVYVVSASTAFFAAAQVDSSGYRSSDLSAAPFILVGAFLLLGVIVSQLFFREDGIFGDGCLGVECGGCGL